MTLNKTFAELCDYYLAYKSVLKRRKRDDESLIRVHLRPFFGSLKLSEVSDKVDEFKSLRIHYHPCSLSHQLTLLISMLRVAHERRWLLEMPHIKKPRVRVFDKDFHYLKTDDEIRRFLFAAQSEGDDVFALYALAVYTGLRPGEQAGLKKDDIQLESRRITVQNSYEGPTKNGEVRYVPVLDPLLPMLRKWLLQSPGPYLFPTKTGTMLEEKARIFDETFRRVLEKANFQKGEKRGKMRNYIRYYDLRHTFASTWMRNGGDIFKLSKILGHKSVQMTMRYAHLAPDAYSSDYGRLGTCAPSGELAPVLSIQSHA
ncbi:site-specific integrase [Bdellovibrionota bacterium FG-2]